MKINKPLAAEIGGISTLLKTRLSEAKTTCKAFSSLFRQYSEAENQFSLSLLRIAQTGAGYLGLKRNFIECKQHENPTVVSIIDKTLQSLIEKSEAHAELARRVYNDLIPRIQETYSEIASGKKRFLKSFKQNVLKERDQIVSKSKKARNGAESLDLEAVQINLEVQFEEKSAEKLAEILKFIEEAEIKKTNAIFTTVKKMAAFESEERQALDKDLNQTLEFFAKTNRFSYKTTEVQGIRESLNLKSLTLSNELGPSPKKALKKRPAFAFDPKPPFLVFPTLPENPQMDTFLSSVGLFPPKIDEFCLFDLKTFNLVVFLAVAFSEVGASQDDVRLSQTLRNRFRLLAKDVSLLNALIEENKQSSSFSLSLSDFFLTTVKSVLRRKSTKIEESVATHLLLILKINEYWTRFLLPDCFAAFIKDPISEEVEFRRKIADFLGKNQKEDLILLLDSGNTRKIGFPVNLVICETLINAVFESSEEDFSEYPLFLQKISEFAQKSLSLDQKTVFFIANRLIFERKWPFTREKRFLSFYSDFLAEFSKVLEQIEEFGNEKAVMACLEGIRFKVSKGIFEIITGVLLDPKRLFLNDDFPAEILVPLLYLCFEAQKKFTSIRKFEDFLSNLIKSCGFNLSLVSEKNCELDYDLTFESDPLDSTLASMHTFLAELTKSLPSISPQIRLLLGPPLKLALPLSPIETFLDGELYRLASYLNFVTENNLYLEDKKGRFFSIAYELSVLDELVESDPSGPDRKGRRFFDLVGPEIELWLQRISEENQKLMVRCLENEDWKASEGRKFTNSVFDFCSLVFKSAELLSKIVKLSNKNAFKALITKRMELIIHKTLFEYSSRLESGLAMLISDLTKKDPKTDKSDKKPDPKNEQTLTELSTKQLTLLRDVCLRLGNLAFLCNQVEEVRPALFPRSEILVGFKADLHAIARRIMKLVNTLLHEIFFPKIFYSQLFNSFSRELFDSTDEASFQAVFSFSLKNLSANLEGYIAVLKSCVSSEFLNINEFIEDFNKTSIPLLETAFLNTKKLPKKLNLRKYAAFLQLETTTWKKLQFQLFDSIPARFINELQQIPELLLAEADTLISYHKSPAQFQQIDQTLLKMVMKLRGKTEKKLKIKS